MWQLALKRLMEFIAGSISVPSAGQSAPSGTPSTHSPSPESGSQSPAGLTMTLIRKVRTERATVGELYLDGVFECYTLEDRDRLAEGLPKISGQTAIPSGEYAVILTHSPRFGRVLPLVQNVRGFEGVRIHSGNDAGDTEGCILVGRIRGPDQVAESRLALESLIQKIENASSISLKIS